MIKIAVCDNDEKEMKLLKDLIEDIMEGYAVMYQIDTFTKGEALLNTELDFQLVFLDIVLDHENGIDVGYAIYRRNRRIKVIFQTNYGQYCKEAMNRSHAFAYLEKPLAKSEVEQQMVDFMKNGMEDHETKLDFRKVIAVYPDRRETKLLVRLLVCDIMYFGYLKAQKKIKIVTQDAEYVYKAAMNAVEERMKPFGFETSCRGILVNLGNVEKIQGYEVFMRNGDRVALSQKRVQLFKMRMNDYIQNYSGRE